MKANQLIVFSLSILFTLASVFGKDKYKWDYNEKDDLKIIKIDLITEKPTLTVMWIEYYLLEGNQELIMLKAFDTSIDKAKKNENVTLGLSDFENRTVIQSSQDEENITTLLLDTHTFSALSKNEIHYISIPQFGNDAMIIPEENTSVIYRDFFNNIYQRLFDKNFKSRYNYDSINEDIIKRFN